MRNAFRMQRAPGERSGAFGPANMAPPPKICDRVGKCSWDSGGSGCECEKWPQWLAEHGLPTKRAVPAPNFEPNMSIDAATMSIDAAKGTTCPYYRPLEQGAFTSTTASRMARGQTSFRRVAAATSWRSTDTPLPLLRWNTF